MNPSEFVNALADGETPFAEDDPDYCPQHGWMNTLDDLYHHVDCDAFAAKLGLK